MEEITLRLLFRPSWIWRPPRVSYNMRSQEVWSAVKEGMRMFVPASPQTNNEELQAALIGFNGS